MEFDWYPRAMREGASGLHGAIAPALNSESTSVPGSDGEIGQLPEQQVDAVEATKALFLMNSFEKERRKNNCR